MCVVILYKFCIKLYEIPTPGVLANAHSSAFNAMLVLDLLMHYLISHAL